MPVFPQLADPAAYRPCSWDLRRDRAGREYWVKLFCEHFSLVEQLITQEYPAATAAQIAALRSDYLLEMRGFLDEPDRFCRMDVLKLTELRRDLLARHGFDDPFAGLKRRETEAALELLPAVFSELRDLNDEERFGLLAQGLMAGNVFDLGALPAIELYQAGQATFRHARLQLPPRPWFIDHLEAWRARWATAGGYDHVFFFLDNAGGDAVLGCIPLAAWMLERGARATLAANSGPALNDITARELADIMPRIAAADAALASAWSGGQLRVVETGNSLPLLNLANVATACAAAAADADLVIFHGMGRAIESNFDARLKCDGLWTAVLKDPAVAAHLGGRLFDCVLQLRAGTRLQVP